MQRSTFRRDIKQQINGWLIINLMGAAVILLPLLYVLFSLLQQPNENWSHIKQFLLVDYLFGSTTLVLFTGSFSIALGVLLAWLVTGYVFPLRRFFRWSLMLPLAIPPYIAAYTYSGMFSYTGVVQTTLRNQFGVTPSPGLFDVMSVRGAVFIFTMFLFPYIFIIVRAYLEKQSASYIENATLLGHRGLSLFFRVVLPISRPAIVGGVMLVVFEVLSDYGVASYFGIQTISTAIFQTWFGMYDVDSAMRLAAWLMIVVIGIFIIERFLRQNRLFSSSTSKSRPLRPKKLNGAAAVGALLFCSLIFMLSFLIPLAQITFWAVWTYHHVWTPDFLELTANTLTVAILATVLVVAFAIVAARACRTSPSRLTYILSKLMTAGYAVPGAIVAIGVLAVFIALDRQLAPLYARLGMGEAALVLSLSLAMLVTGYVIRFMATGYNAIEAGYEKVGRSYTEASQTLGHRSISTFFKVELPLIKGAVFSGFILTFVEIVKELPLALLLRPFNFNTLSTKAYQYANDERIYEASIPSLFIIGISLASVLMIHQLGKRGTS